MRTLALGFAVLLVVSASISESASAQEARRKANGYPPEMPGSRSEVYKKVGDVELNLYIYEPAAEAAKASDKPASDKPAAGRPAVVFFFGGGWNSGSPSQFREQCKHLAERGIVAIAADYRVASRHQVKPQACVADAKSAIRYVRREAARLGIDPERIVAAGGSAGGHIAACTATLEEFDEPDEDAKVSSVPNACVLFNPALVLAPVEGVELDMGRVTALAARLGIEPQRLSPMHHIRAGQPPMLVLHGKADTTVPYATAEAFAKAMTAAGNRCELVGYEAQPHGFFNHGRGDGKHYTETVAAMDRFLASLGYLPAR
jgi:acetyl esterase